VLSQNGHVVGAPTYVPAGELALLPAAHRRGPASGLP
jgi:hypothetical protein